MKRWLTLLAALMVVASARAGTTNVWIDAETNLYVVIGISTNLVTAIHLIPTNPVVSQCSDYANLTNIEDMVETRPTQNELGYTLGCALVQTRTLFKNWIDVEHNYDGTHVSGFVDTNYLADAAVTSNKLDGALRSKLGVASDTVPATVKSQGALYYTGWGSEAAGSAIQTRSTETNITVVSVSANSYATLVIEGEALLINDSGGVQEYGLHLSDGPANKYYGTLTGTAIKVTATSALPVRFTMTTAGGSAKTLTLKASSGNGSVDSRFTVQCLSFRVLGVP